MASAPVSPMKIRAGAAFHQRNPASAPIMPAATIADIEHRQFVDRVAARCEMPGAPTCMAELPEGDEHVRRHTRIDEPAASPSSPSVRFIACDDAVSTRKHHSEEEHTQRRPCRRMNDTLVTVPVASAYRITMMPKSTETTAVARNFCDLVNPKDRRRRTFVKSSANPTRPKPTAANTSASPAGGEPSAVIRAAT